MPVTPASGTPRLLVMNHRLSTYIKHCTRQPERRPSRACNTFAKSSTNFDWADVYRVAGVTAEQSDTVLLSQDTERKDADISREMVRFIS